MHIFKHEFIFVWKVKKELKYFLPLILNAPKIKKMWRKIGNFTFFNGIAIN